jgi:acyl carrier protein
MAQKLVTEEKVIEVVKQAVVETLNSDESIIKPDSSLIKDLGAESLDFLDINYRIEQAFGIKMARHFILEHIEEMFGEGVAVDDDNLLTDKAVQLLNIRFGKNHTDISPGIDMDEVPAFITIKSMADGIMDILNSLPEECPSCSKSTWKSDDGIRITCGSCGEPATFTNGDDLIKEWLTMVQAEQNIF